MVRRAVDRFVQRLRLRYRTKIHSGLLPLFAGLCSSASIAQVPAQKDDRTIKAREEWRKILT